MANRTNIGYARPRLKPGDRLETGSDQYTISSFLGAGANGTVHHAVARSTNQSVAVKVFSPREQPSDGALRARLQSFKNEMRKMQRASHWNVVDLVDWGRVKISGRDLPITVMELAAESLRDWLSRRTGSLQKLLVMAQVCEGVDHLNRNCALVYRDIKPENILLMGDGIVKLADLGIAELVPDLETAATSLGSLYSEDVDALKPSHYFSPEQLRRAMGDDSVDMRRSDVFQVGRVLHELFTGSNPVGQIVIGGADYAHVPRRIAELIAAMLAEEPGRRPRLELCTAVTEHRRIALSEHVV